MVDEYHVWARSEGKYVDRRYNQYSVHLRTRIHALPIADLAPGLLCALKAQLLKTPIGQIRSGKKSGNSANNGEYRLLAGSTVNLIFSFLRTSITNKYNR